jgi:hypothetical protein
MEWDAPATLDSLGTTRREAQEAQGRKALRLSFAHNVLHHNVLHHNVLHDIVIHYNVTHSIVLHGKTAWRIAHNVTQRITSDGGA